MLIALIARDKPGALQIRLDTRDAHVAYLKSSDAVTQAGPLLDAEGRMCGSLIVLEVADMAEAEAFLRALSGRRHRVITSVAVRRRDRLWSRDVVTCVRMKSLSQAEIAGYLATGDWQGKAGGYGIQGPAGALIPWISGSFTAVVGLPLTETAGLLQAAGYPVWTART